MNQLRDSTLLLISLPYRISAIIAFDLFVSYIAVQRCDRRNKRHGALSILFTWSRDERDGKRTVAVGWLFGDAIKISATRRDARQKIDLI